MLRISGRHGRRLPLHSGPGHRKRGPAPRRFRLAALVGAVTAAVVLPLAVASARQVGDAGRAVVPAAPRAAGTRVRPVTVGRSPRPLGPDLATGARCGPELTSPQGFEAQTCVLTQGAETWARAYYRNATGEPLDAELSLLGPDGRTVQMHCVTGADDEPGTCETPREHTRGAPDTYLAVSEFAVPGTDGALLLRSGSNAPESKGS
ncbi:MULTISPECIES: hypothetical protein [unclassified Streptomyces]|uniref:hypothetical protein n=1 Tax=unclassified Streptomyces TaxID=2593676 RepID=UPI001F04E71C|nr:MULTISPECIES: hypothetical protein [unclassified Streptomyces]